MTENASHALILRISHVTLICYSPKESALEKRAKDSVYAKWGCQGLQGTVPMPQHLLFPLRNQPRAEHSSSAPLVSRQLCTWDGAWAGAAGIAACSKMCHQNNGMPQPRARLTSQSMCLGVCSWSPTAWREPGPPGCRRAAALSTPAPGPGADGAGESRGPDLAGAAVDMGQHHVGHQPTRADPDPESKSLAERRMQGVGAQAHRQQGGLMG